MAILCTKTVISVCTVETLHILMLVYSFLPHPTWIVGLRECGVLILILILELDFDFGL